MARPSSQNTRTLLPSRTSDTNPCSVGVRIENAVVELPVAAAVFLAEHLVERTAGGIARA